MKCIDNIRNDFYHPCGAKYILVEQVDGAERVEGQFMSAQEIAAHLEVSVHVVHRIMQGWYRSRTSSTHPTTREMQKYVIYPAMCMRFFSD